MVAVPFGISAYLRRDARSVNIIVRNVYLEKSPENQVDGLVRISRPGLSLFGTFGLGPIRGIFKQLGSINNVYLVVSGRQLYSVTSTGAGTLIDTIGGSHRVNFAANATKVLIATGGTLYSTDGMTLSIVPMPDNILVSSVEYVNGYFLITIVNSQRIYFIRPGETSPDALSFFSAEYAPDNLVCGRKIGDEYWAFGDSTIEPHAGTGNPDEPFQRIQGRLYDKGCANRDTIAKLDNTLFWVGKDGTVYRADATPIRVSDFGIEERLRKGDQASFRAWAFEYSGHSFYCLTIGEEGTFLYDVSAQGWVEWNTYGRDIWRCHVGIQTDGQTIVAGDSISGDVWQIDPTQTRDGGNLPIIRELIGGLPITGASKPCNSFSANVATGWTREARASLPSMEMRYSDDGGNLWGQWLPCDLGRRGQYGQEVAWRRLGMMKQPGKIFHIRCGDDTVYRFSYARVNEAFGTK